MNSIARLLTLLTALLGLAGTACAQNTWEVSPTDVESNRRGLAGVGVGRPALDSWEADAGTLVFHAEPTGTTVTFSCGTKEARTYRNDVSILVYSDEACTQQVTSGFVRSGNTVVTANPISQAGTFYCILASPDGGGTTYFRHTFGINVKAAPVVPVKTGLQLTPPTTAQLPGGSFTILVKAVDATGNTTTIDGSSTAVTWTFDSNVFTRSGARFTVKSTAATSSQTISAIYNGLGGSCTVQVNKPTITSLSLTGVPIVAQTVGKSFTPILTATMSAGPSVKIPASTPGLIWNVNPSILSISNGVVSVLSGTVDSTPLSVQAVGIESNVVNVLIKKLPPTLTSITATPSSTTLAPGGSFTPGLALTYSDNTAKTISPTQTGLTWKFDATIFVRNSSTGAFTLKSSSTAAAGNLTATYSGKSAGIAVAIARAPFVTGIALDPIPSQPRGTTTAPTTFTTVVKKLLSDGSSAVISDATLTCDSAVFTVKTQGQIQVKPTSTATSGTVTARFGTFSDTKTVSITANAPVPKAIKAVNLVVPTASLLPGASFTPAVEITWADGTKTTSNLATAGIPYSFDPYSLTPGTAGLLTVLSSTKSTLGKITVTPPNLQPKTAYVRITQSVVPQKSYITSHVNGAIFGASSGTFTATMVTADRVTLRVILNDDTFIDSKSFSPGQIPSITVTGLPLIRSRIKIQATSYYNGNMGSDLLGIPANDIVELYPRASYPAPVNGCVGANAFVLDAFGIPSGTILTPYSLYQFFETFGVARQRASSEVGTSLLSAIPDGAIVFFLDPSMSLPWKRPTTNEDRSLIVSRKAYGDAGIWDAKSQTLINLTDGTKVGADNLLTMYDEWGTGADFTSKFVYGWVTAEDFLSAYSVAAANDYAASSMGEINFGILPSSLSVGRHAFAGKSTPQLPNFSTANYPILPTVTLHVSTFVVSTSSAGFVFQSGGHLLKKDVSGKLTVDGSSSVAHSTLRNLHNDLEFVLAQALLSGLEFSQALSDTARDVFFGEVKTVVDLAYFLLATAGEITGLSNRTDVPNDQWLRDAISASDSADAFFASIGANTESKAYIIGQFIDPSLVASILVTADKLVILSTRDILIEVSKREALNGLTDYEAYKTLVRLQMAKPKVIDASLKSIIERAYRSEAIIGTGSTASAVRQEIITGKPVFNKFHSQKAENLITELNKWLLNHPDAAKTDSSAALNVLIDMRNALDGL